jgi:hypothetical protein
MANVYGYTSILCAGSQVQLPREPVCGLGNRYSDMRSVYCGGQQCKTPDQAGPYAAIVCT